MDIRRIQEILSISDRLGIWWATVRLLQGDFTWEAAHVPVDDASPFLETEQTETQIVVYVLNEYTKDYDKFWWNTNTEFRGIILG